MSSPADQIKELTLGLRLPMPALVSVHLDVIIEAIERALNELVNDYGAGLLQNSEIELNALVQARLNGMKTSAEPFGQIVHCVVRGAESASFDGEKLEKRPDLSIYLTNRHANFPLVLECKIIDSANKKGIDLYCTQGIQRFVDGRYGWANKQSLMLAYVRDGSSIDGDLKPYLKDSAGKPPDPLRTEVLPGAPSVTPSRSQHSRSFAYLEPRHDPPGSMSISHIWFDLSAALAAS